MGVGSPFLATHVRYRDYMPIFKLLSRGASLRVSNENKKLYIWELILPFYANNSICFVL